MRSLVFYPITAGLLIACFFKFRENISAYTIVVMRKKTENKKKGKPANPDHTGADNDADKTGTDTNADQTRIDQHDNKPQPGRFDKPTREPDTDHTQNDTDADHTEKKEEK